MALPDCETIRAVLAGYLYGDLSAGEKARVDDHMRSCGACREALGSLQEAASALDAWKLAPLRKPPTPISQRRVVKRRAAPPSLGAVPAFGWAAAAAVFLLVLVLSIVSRSRDPEPAPVHARAAEPEPVAAPPDPAGLERARKEAREELAQIEAERRRSRERLESIEREWEQLLQEKKKEAEGAHQQALARIEGERKKTEQELDRTRDAQFKAEEKLVRAESKGTVAVIAQLDWVQGEVYLLTPSGRVPALTAKVLVSGQGLETVGAESAAVVRFPDSTRLEVSAATTIRQLSDAGQGKQVDLVLGTLKADVAKQPAERPMTIRTPDAEVRVLGTRFRLVSQDGTRLDVQEGKVRFSRPKDGASVDVSGGNYVTSALPRLYPKPLREVAFQDGVAPVPSYAGTRDSFLSETYPAHNYGTNPIIQVDGDNPSGSGRELRMVLRWDTAAIPPGSKIQSAAVVLHLRGRGQPPYEVHGIKRSWSETDVCWQSLASDQGVPILGVALPVSPAEYSFPLGAEGIALVQSWVDSPATNFGFMLTAPKNSFGLQVHAREASDASKRPKLVVTYTPR